jgi:tetratricopeptide (TPR) repeat protein
METELTDLIVTAAEKYDRPLTADLASELKYYLRTAKIERKPAENVLKALRANRWFDLLQSTADTLMQSGQNAPSVRKLYAQALIDNGAITAAITFLERMAQECRDDRVEHPEALGLLGRAYKQMYINENSSTPEESKQLLQTAIGYYYDVYRADRDALWHGINAVALIARAESDHVPIDGFPPPCRIAAGIVATIDDLNRYGCLARWDLATAAEACVALGQWDEAVKWLDRYLAEPQSDAEPRRTDAFAIGGTLRQFTEVWRLASASEQGAAIVELLKAALLDRSGGASIDVGSTDLQQARPVDTDLLQRVLGADRYQTLEWYRNGLDRSRAVSRLGVEATTGLGTGFLVRGEDFHPSFAGKQLLVTNAHVLSSDVARALRPEEAVVTFESLQSNQKKYSVRILWSSPPGDLDATIAVLNDTVEGFEPYPIAPALPSRRDPTRLYVIGHPGGGTLSFSIDDNMLLDHEDPFVHYRSPTDPGSSGSPVFNRTWALVALHHAGGTTMRRLHEEGTYAANEGIYIGTIIRRFAADVDAGHVQIP